MPANDPGHAGDRHQEEWLAPVLSVLRGEISAADAASRLGLSIEEVEELNAGILEAAGQGMAGRAVGDRADEDRAASMSVPDMGIWVCGTDEQPLAPYLFLQSVCKGREPRETLISWRGPGDPPKHFRVTRRMSVLHGEKLEVAGGTSISLLCARVKDRKPMEQKTALSDWAFPAQIRGIIGLLDVKVRGNGTVRLSPGFGPADTTLNWVRRQDLPFVIAAMGCDEGATPEPALRERLGVPSTARIACGPPLRRGQAAGGGPSSQASGGIRGLVSLFLGGTLGFDASYAQRLVHTLTDLVAQ
ncbi:MAG TPA: hypothetical protein VJP78_12925 [Thermoleophilia bacterium]|nr:hypothetical protein [Thermoleophilia bacterium]